MKKMKPRHYVYVTLLLLIILSYTGTLVLWHHQRGEIRSLNTQITTLTSNQAASQGSTYYDVTISPVDKSVYMPLANLKLSATPLNESLVYTYTGPYTISGDKKVFPANLSLSTHELAANAVSTTQQFDCSQIVYADFVTPSYPVNPMWKSDGSTKLADGRIMNVYYAPSIPGCQASWKLNNINSKDIADSLKEATSY
jgi:hypothetical protein